MVVQWKNTELAKRPPDTSSILVLATMIWRAFIWIGVAVLFGLLLAIEYRVGYNDGARDLKDEIDRVLDELKDEEIKR